MLDCLANEKLGLLTGAIFAEQRHKGGLARLGIAPGRLARSRFVSAMVDKVVSDLESETDVAGIAAIRGSGIRRHLVHDARGLDGIFDERAGLELLKPGDRGEIERLALGSAVHHLATRHAVRSGCLRKLQHKVGPYPRVLMGLRVGEDLERKRV